MFSLQAVCEAKPHRPKEKQAGGLAFSRSMMAKIPDEY